MWLAGSIFSAPLQEYFRIMDYQRPEPIYEISYEETLEDVENPGRGFYVPVYVHYLPEGNQIPENESKLWHLRIDLAEFSGKYNKKADAELTKDVLDALEETLKSMEENGRNAVIRFSYDPWFSGKKTYEPSMQVILQHQKQLGEVLSRHPEVIASLECGIFGKWGEMHGSDACSQENFNQVIDQWLKVLPVTIPISVRTPAQYCGWCGIDLGSIEEQVTLPGQKEYRVGIYNDGYLASDTDLGTYADRQKEIAWLYNQARHTLFGGETGIPYGKQEEIRATAAYMEKEAFLTHLSYLHVDWNKEVAKSLKEEVYEGADARYVGESGYVYVRNHLGYRFVLRGVSLTKKVSKGQKLILEANVENVGFANLVKPKELSILLKDEDGYYSFAFRKDELKEGMVAENYDPTAWDSQTVTNVSLAIPLPEELPLGEYQVLIRIASPAAEGKIGMQGYPVRFANDDDNVWDQESGGNFIGTITITN